MPIICIEGPPAVGKTTVSLELEDTYGCYIVPEAGPSMLPEYRSKCLTAWGDWCEQQISRWHLALKKSAEHAVVVLDGDVFQPLLACGLLHSPYVKQVSNMLQQAFIERQIGFPDSYYYLCARESTLRKRAASDMSKFVTYTPKTEDFYYDHRGFYRNLSKAFPGTVQEIQAFHEQKAAKEIMKNLPLSLHDKNTIEKFEYVRAQMDKKF